MKKIYLRKSDEGIAFMHINDPVNKMPLMMSFVYSYMVLSTR